jgi:hypothetical protein
MNEFRKVLFIFIGTETVKQLFEFKITDRFYFKNDLGQNQNNTKVLFRIFQY